MIFKRFFGRKTNDDQAYRLYRTLVTQARSPQFYLTVGVPDTLTGRFEMIVVHMFLIMDRLTAAGDKAGDLGQVLFDVMFDDMDQAMREIGVGDLSVGKKIKTMGQAFYGRISVYDAAFRSEDPADLEEAVLRNVYPDMDVPREKATTLAEYMRDARKHLWALDDDAVVAAEVDFPQAPSALVASGEASQ